MNLRFARKAAGLTQREVSKLIGVDRTSLSRWELGQVPVSDYYLHRLAVALKCPISYLKGTEGMTPNEHMELERDHSTLEDIEIIRTFQVLSPANRVALIYAARGFLECQRAQAEISREEAYGADY